MNEHAPVLSVADLDSIDTYEVADGYLDGFKGEPEPGDNRSRSYWHGWHNGNDDRRREPRPEARVLARAVTEASRSRA